jgi:hypothetical protein
MDYKIYDRKTVGHVFTKPVQIEGTNQYFFHRKLFFIIVHLSADRRCEFMYVVYIEEYRCTHVDACVVRN